jgi:serralysin
MVLGSGTGFLGGVPVAGTLDLTPDILMKFAFQNDSDGATLNLIGNTGNDTLGGSNYDDIIIGGGSSDLMTGHGGDDRYFVDRSSDVIVETGGQGNDTVIATGHYALQAGVSVEWMRTMGSTSTYNINLTGNSGNNLIQGNAGINRLDGGSGSDRLYGYDGNDFLTGGLGRDFMTGGDGNDRFGFDSVAEIGKSTTRDVIRDFDHGSDVIDLFTIDANALAAGNSSFRFLAGEGDDFTGVAGQLHWFQQNASGTSSDKTIIEGDINGDAHADFQIQLTGLKTLTSADFFF